MSQDKPGLTVAQIEEFRAVIVRGEPGPQELLSDEVFEARANALCDLALIGLDRQRSSCDHIWFPGDEGCRKCGASRPPAPHASAQTGEKINEPPQDDLIARIRPVPASGSPDEELIGRLSQHKDWLREALDKWYGWMMTAGDVERAKATQRLQPEASRAVNRRIDQIRKLMERQ